MTARKIGVSGHGKTVRDVKSMSMTNYVEK